MTHENRQPIEVRSGSEGLLEREQALSALIRVTEAVRAGRGHVLFVEGEAGLGKTELLRRIRPGLRGGPRASASPTAPAWRKPPAKEQH